jgi:hypothetical protein
MDPKSMNGSTGMYDRFMDAQRDGAAAFRRCDWHAWGEAQGRAQAIIDQQRAIVAKLADSLRAAETDDDR